MTLVVRGALWIVLFAAVAIAPLGFAAIGTTAADRGFVTELSTALGFVGLSLLGLEFALVARFRSVTEPFGANSLLQFHRNMGLTGLAFIGVHVAISAQWDAVAGFFDAGTPWRVRFGVVAAVGLGVLVSTSVWRTRLRLSYEAWHRLHAALAVIVIVTAVTHVLLVDYYISMLWKQALWLFMAGGFIGLLVWIRIVTPARLRRRPWTVERIERRPGDATTLTLRPVGHPGLQFQPGQFAWFAIDKSPMTITKHPFSLSSSAENTDTIEVTIKALGDFTATVADIEPGTKAYVDGPYGVFSPDRHQGAGFCLVSGGIGVTPSISVLRTLADRGDRRPIVAIVAHEDVDQMTFADELEQLRSRLALTVVHTLEHAPPGWDQETGLVDGDLLRRHLPDQIAHWQFFICGPDPMMDAVTDALLDLDVDSSRIHSERFGWT
jgi:predicted ferric reductase